MIRRALPADAAALSGLALRSKAHWGYDEAFMSACVPLLAVSESYIAAAPVFVLERDGALAGFYGLSGTPPVCELEYLFVDPDAIGTGTGAQLWGHAVGTASEQGFRTLRIEADPNAAAFYERMGATLAGTARSGVGGRGLPVFEFALKVSPAPADT